MENIDTNEITSKIDTMLSVVKSFIELINAENQALEAGDIKTIKSLYAQKIKIVVAYRSLCAFFIKNTASVSEYNSSSKDELKAAACELDKQLKRNELLLKTHMDTGRMVMDTFINIAKKNNVAQISSYGSRGAYGHLDNSRNALAYNQTM